MNYQKSETFHTILEKIDDNSDRSRSYREHLQANLHNLHKFDYANESTFNSCLAILESIFQLENSSQVRKISHDFKRFISLAESQ